MIHKINLKDKFASFDDTWSPKLVGEVNEFHVKLSKVKGDFIWHHHESEDELFLVVKGKLRIKLRGQEDLVLAPGELAIIPRGVEHNPVADEETHVVLFEPAGTLNTGNVQNERTVNNLKKI